MFFEDIAKKWHYYTYEIADPRTRDRPLMGTPIPILVLCSFYVIFNNYILKGIMRNRSPIGIRFASIAYNSYLLSAYLYFSYKLSYFWFFKYNWRCEPVDQSYSQESLEVNAIKILLEQTVTACF
jgi:GNS1/SUR4 family